MHGIGVKTPRAAAVAAATVGLAGDMHIPKLIMLSMGTKSTMVAGGPTIIMVLVTGKTIRGQGALPIGHIRSVARMVLGAILLLNRY